MTNASNPVIFTPCKGYFNAAALVAWSPIKPSAACLAETGTTAGLSEEPPTLITPTTTPSLPVCMPTSGVAPRIVEDRLINQPRMPRTRLGIGGGARTSPPGPPPSPPCPHGDRSHRRRRYLLHHYQIRRRCHPRHQHRALPELSYVSLHATEPGHPQFCLASGNHPSWTSTCRIRGKRRSVVHTGGYTATRKPFHDVAAGIKPLPTSIESSAKIPVM